MGTTEGRKEDGQTTRWSLSGTFPFVSPDLLWRVMAGVGFATVVSMTIFPINAHAGGSQLNAALCIFQSIMLWHAPRYSDATRKAFAQAAFFSYAWCVGSIGADLLLESLGAIETFAFAATAGLFWSAAQANLAFLNAERTLHPSILSQGFSWSTLRAQSQRQMAERRLRVLAILSVVGKAFLGTLAVSSASLGMNALGKQDLVTFLISHHR